MIISATCPTCGHKKSRPFPRAELCQCGKEYQRGSGRQNSCPDCLAVIRLERSKTPEAQQKLSAQKAVRAAILKGQLVRQPCEYLGGDIKNLKRCGKPKTHAHHEDYTKPLDVYWLCSSCHGWHHAFKATERLPVRDNVTQPELRVVAQ